MKLNSKTNKSDTQTCDDLEYIAGNINSSFQINTIHHILNHEKFLIHQMYLTMIAHH